jgi:hypothetical protein
MRRNILVTQALRMSLIFHDRTLSALAAGPSSSYIELNYFGLTAYQAET